MTAGLRSSSFSSFSSSALCIVASLARPGGNLTAPQLAPDDHKVPPSIAQHVDKVVRSFIVPHAFEFYQTGEGATDRLKQLASFVLTTGNTHAGMRTWQQGLGISERGNGSQGPRYTPGTLRAERLRGFAFDFIARARF
jgi:hypothetical protein